MVHEAPRETDASVDEFWLENPFDFERLKGFNLSMFERNRLYMGLGDGTFADGSHSSGVDLESDGRAVAIGDLDEDGRPDLILRSAGGGALRVFLNDVQTGRSVQVRLRGRTSNSDGIGARLWLRVGDRTLYREHFPANGLQAQCALETIFGVGDAEGPFELEVRWPSGKSERRAIDVGRHRIVEPD